MSNQKITLGDVLGLVFADAIKLLEKVETDADRIEKTFTDRTEEEQTYMRGFLNNDASVESTIEFMKCINGAIKSAELQQKMTDGNELLVYDLLNIILDAFTEIDGRPFKITVSKR